MHFEIDYTKYLGIPFKYGGRDTTNLDCYGLVALLYRDLRGIHVPEVVSPDTLQSIAELLAVEKNKWKPCEIKEGAVLVFNIKGYGSHVGYVIGDNYFIHTWEHTHGVTIERISLWKNKIIGIYEFVE